MVETGEGERQCAHPVLGGGAHGVGMGTRQEERGVRRLHGAGHHYVPGRSGGCLNVEKVAMPGEIVPEPDLPDDLQRLAHLGDRSLGVDVAERHLLQRAAAAGAEVEAPVRNDVEHGGALGDPGGVVVVEGHAHHPVTDADSRGPGRHGGEEDLRCAHVRVPVQGMVLDGPHTIEAHLLGENRLFETVPYDLLLPLPGRIGELSFEDHGKLHGGRAPFPFGGSSISSTAIGRFSWYYTLRFTFGRTRHDISHAPSQAQLCNSLVGRWRAGRYRGEATRSR